jgi:hypothetical protein
MRVVNLRALTLGVVVAWAALTIYAVTQNLAPGAVAAWATTICGVYLLTIGALMPKEPKVRDA